METYTLFYCEKHDKGVLVVGLDDNSQPSWLHSCCSSKNLCDDMWEYHGFVTFNNGMLDNQYLFEQSHYDRVGGGWCLSYATCGQIFDKDHQVVETPSYVKTFFDTL